MALGRWKVPESKGNNCVLMDIGIPWWLLFYLLPWYHIHIFWSFLIFVQFYVTPFLRSSILISKDCGYVFTKGPAAWAKLDDKYQCPPCGKLQKEKNIPLLFYWIDSPTNPFIHSFIHCLYLLFVLVYELCCNMFWTGAPKFRFKKVPKGSASGKVEVKKSWFGK